MSDSLKNKIYNYEEIPPVSVWEKVAVSLDEKLLNNETLAQLCNQEETPPNAVWNKISNSLDIAIQETKFRNEILEDEAHPPPSTWNKIARQLDADKQENISQKVQEYEITPPVSTWKNIAATLDAEQETTPVISIQKKSPKIIRFAAAAVILGVLAWTGFNIINNGNTVKENNLANNETKNIQPISPVITANPPVTEETNNDPINENDIVVVKPVIKKTISKDFSNNQDRPEVTPIETDNHTSSEELAVTDNKNIHKKKKPTTSTVENKTEARYFVYFNEQGDMVNLSKKLADLKCIYTKDGSVSQESLAKLSKTECNDQLKYWQDKMANSSLQSSSNPLALMDVLK